MVSEHEVRVADGRVVHAFDSGPEGALTVVWHHGSPQTGAILQPLLDEGAKRGLRWISIARPGYGGSTPNPGRSIGSVASEVARVLDELGVGRFATMGASGGGPHALACAALLADRIEAAVTFACPTPYDGRQGWLDGMAAPAALRSALEGRSGRAAFAEKDEFDPSQFIDADWATLGGPWQSLGQDAQRAEQAGPDGLVDDDLALVNPWAFDLGAISAPVLLVQGGADRVIPASHAMWLLPQIPTAELWLRPNDGHVSVLRALPVALDWLLEMVTTGGRR